MISIDPLLFVGPSQTVVAVIADELLLQEPAMNFVYNLGSSRTHLSPKKAVALISALVALYSLSRVGVLFFEALAVVREERSQDNELLELCARGDARSSPKMRDACLKARAERASPLIAKAIVYAVSTAFKDFSSTVGSPFKFAVVVLFVISSVVLPIMPWARAIFGTHASGIPHDGSFSTYPNHFIVMAPQTPSSVKTRLKRKIVKHIPLLRHKPTLQEIDDSSYEDMETMNNDMNRSWSSYPFSGHAHND